MLHLFDLLQSVSGSVILLLTSVLFVLQAVILSLIFIKTQSAHRERVQLYQELFGLMKKIEGLSAGKRAIILHQFDNLLDSLIKQLPTRIATEAGERIFETESQLIKTLVELEPSLRADRLAHQRLEKLIQSMEKLEETVVRLTCDSVKQSLLDVRHSFLAQESIKGG